jgi:8-oxo-dGTP pyrophosphatase MutT (NUDIX family)
MQDEEEDQRDAKPMRYRINRYNDVVVIQSSLIKEPAEFERSLARLLATATAARRNAVWVKLPSHLSHLIPVAQKLQFETHHANPANFAMVRWLGDGASRTSYASHHVRVRAIVSRWVATVGPEVLLVRERRAFNDPVWKLPGGLVEDELVADCAIREVLEETGCRSVFAGILAINNRAHARWDNGEIVIACLLRPLQPAAPLKHDPQEILECEWVGVKEAARRLLEGKLATAIDMWFLSTAFGDQVRYRDLEPSPDRNVLRSLVLDDFGGGGRNSRMHMHSLNPVRDQISRFVGRLG